MNTAKKALKAAGIAAFWLLVWTLLSICVGKEILLPSPLAVIGKLGVLVLDADFWLSCGASLLRICAGLVSGAAAGVIIAVLCVRFKTVNALISPILSVVRATPVASFIILALVWLGRGRVPSFTSFLMVLPVVAGTVTVAIRSIDVQLLEMMQVFGVPRRRIFSKLYLPGVLPSFAGGFKTSLGLAWKAGVAAEVLCTPKYSIGSSLYDSKVYLETAELFAWTTAVIALSMLLEHMFDRLTKRLQAKYSAGGKTDA